MRDFVLHHHSPSPGAVLIWAEAPASSRDRAAKMAALRPNQDSTQIPRRLTAGDRELK